MKREDIRIRNPFILGDKQTKNYYMYGTTDLEYDSYASYPKFSAYVSKDLENFEGPFVVFDGGHAMRFETFDGKKYFSLLNLICPQANAQYLFLIKRRIYENRRSFIENDVERETLSVGTI